MRLVTLSITMHRSWNAMRAAQLHAALVISLSEPLSASKLARAEDDAAIFLAASSVLFTARTEESIKGEASNGVIHDSGRICAPQ